MTMNNFEKKAKLKQLWMWKTWPSSCCEDMEWEGRKKVEINLWNVAMIKRHPLFVTTKGTTCVIEMNVFSHKVVNGGKGLG
jgi:hypothetical protein